MECALQFTIPSLGVVAEMQIENPYLMFLGDAADDLAAKVANGVAKWRPDWCKGQLRLEGCKADLGLQDMTLEEAKAAGCKTVIVGVANRGGIIPQSWLSTLEQALVQQPTMLRAT